MNSKEEETGEVFREWTDVLPIIRKHLNKIRAKPQEDPFKQVIKPVDMRLEAKFKIGDVVYHRSESPLSSLGHKQSTAKFRVGDTRWLKVPKKIVNVFRDADVGFRYYLENIPNVSYTENEIILAPNQEKETKYVVERFLDVKTEKKQKYYLVKWKKYKIKDATWEKQSELIKDIGKDIFNEHVNRMKKK
jgi:hypothetical protein